MNYFYAYLVLALSIGFCSCQNQSSKTLFEDGQFKECFEIAESMDTSNFNNYEAFYYAALSAKSMGEYCLSLEKFYVCEKLNPFDNDLQNLILETEGFATYSQCSFLKRWVEARYWLSKNFITDYYSKYEELLERNSYDSAEVILRQLQRMGPNDVSISNLLGLYFEEVEEFDSSLYYLNKSISLRTNSCVLLCNRGRVLFTMGEIKEGINDYEAALALCPDSCLIYEGYILSLKSVERNDLIDLLKKRGAIKGCKFSE